MATLGWAILEVILINGLFAFWQDFQASKALDAMERLLPSQVNVLREDTVERLSATELVPGDIIILQEGDNIPADCRLIETFGTKVNNANRHRRISAPD